MPSYEKVIDIYNSMEKLKSKLDTTEEKSGTRKIFLRKFYRIKYN